MQTGFYIGYYGNDEVIDAIEKENLTEDGKNNILYMVLGIKYWNTAGQDLLSENRLIYENSLTCISLVSY